MVLITTAHLLLDRSLGDTAGQECVDWAIGMLEEGRDGYYLTRLAGMLPPHNHFEISNLRDKALIELGIADMSADDAVVAYAVELLRNAIHSDSSLIRSIATLAGLYVANEYQCELNDFYLLHYAYEDLQHDDIQWYWNGATRKNILNIMRERARQFLSAHIKAKQ
jgi:hypothetical protein